ncbi:hypothetical protein [Burkholderia vietnamiensis]|uniref:hypothetical protein n=1 Tax=Burkholderia vietnamiensis TaxID=60552 RepID=UPI00158B2A8A|nr:hypothetical protein [Burkholderia vietnamiensis]
MTDRELLELAAKAAGYRVYGWINDKLYVINGPNPAEYYDPFSWNPLSDDGDALRLACDCYIGIEFRSGYVIADGPQDAAAEEFKDGDRRAATRCAIVRAAAEIGKATEPE